MRLTGTQVTNVSHRESKTVKLPQDHATIVCAAKEGLSMFRKPVLELFGNWPEYGHNWATDVGNTNLDRGTFWKWSSESFLSLKAFMVKKPKYELWGPFPVTHECLQDKPKLSLTSYPFPGYH
jgi:hypothetical protein|uniref:Uncharacterized protein n=1 Tax=Mus musculus TaxID=10090 RepID=Q3URS7_MOUSE|nr:unnamed protein product [Mus musculus]